MCFRGREVRCGPTVQVTVVGDVDLATSGGLDCVLRAVTDGGELEFAVDMEQVRFMDSSGVRVLARAGQELRRRGGRLVLQSLAPRVARLFRLLRMADALEGACPERATARPGSPPKAGRSAPAEGRDGGAKRPSAVGGWAVAREAGFLERLGVEEREALAPLLQHRLYRAGEALFRQGDVPSHLFVVHSGLVKVVQCTETGRCLMLELLHPGDLCGGLDTVCSQPYDASAICLAPTELSRIPRGPFLDLAIHRPRLLLHALEDSRRNAERQRKLLLAILFQRAECRAAVALLSLADRIGAREGQGTALPLLPRASFAEMIGTSVETATRVLGRLRRRGLIRERPGGLLVVDERSLRKIAGF